LRRGAKPLPVKSYYPGVVGRRFVRKTDHRIQILEEELGREGDRRSGHQYI